MNRAQREQKNHRKEVKRKLYKKRMRQRDIENPNTDLKILKSIDRRNINRNNLKHESTESKNTG